MLALGLTTVILLAVSMTIDLHLRSFESRRNYLEQSQLAREILNIISNDIRGVVQNYEQDLSTLDSLVSKTVESALGGLPEAAGGMEGESGSGSGESGSSLDTSSVEDLLAGDESLNTTDLGAAVTFPTTPGLYGNQFELQLDVSRLPRFDEYQKMMSDPTEGLADIPSDVKTVTYYVTNQQSAAAVSDVESLATDISTSTDPSVVGRGLVRRQLDRAVAQYAQLNGMLTAAQSAGDVIAPEVVSIEFQYFDGVEWRIEWDTETDEGLPLAIQIQLVMDSRSASNRTNADAAELGDLDSSNYSYYRMLVPIATAQETASAEDTSLEAAGL